MKYFTRVNRVCVVYVVEVVLIYGGVKPAKFVLYLLKFRRSCV